jgi:hypothetical protein
MKNEKKVTLKIFLLSNGSEKLYNILKSLPAQRLSEQSKGLDLQPFTGNGDIPISMKNS